MADGLSTAASVIAVIQIATSVACVGYEYLSSAKRAPECLKRLTDELKSLIEILTEIHICAQDPRSKLLQRLDSPLQQCFADMINLHGKLSPRKSSDFWGSIQTRLRWPFEESDIMDHLVRMERLKNSFILAISLDQQSLAKTTASHVGAISAHVRGIDGRMQAVDLNFQGVGMNVTKIREDITHLRTVQNLNSREAGIIQNEKQRAEILDWLYPEDFRTMHESISTRRKVRTGDWIFEENEFCNWIEMIDPHRILWGYGIPGAGKTFLSSRVIDYLECKAPAAGYGVAHIYFNYKDQSRQTPVKVLASLVKQLACKTPNLPQSIIEMYNKFHDEKRRPGLEDLYESFLSIVSSGPFNRVIIVCDALDECDPSSQRLQLLPLFHRMGNDGASLFLTSREYPEDIQSSLDGKSAKLKLSANDQDIHNYIVQKIEDNPRAKRLVREGGIKDMIISKLIKCADGMFLLVHFHIEHLCQQPTTAKILQELEKFNISSYSTEGKPLDQTYDRAMERLRSQPQNCVDLAMRALFWVVGAHRTLRIQELQVAVSLEAHSKQTTIDDRDLPDVKTLLDVCTNFLTIDDYYEVRLVHYTVQEYLLENSIVPARQDLALELSILCTVFLSLDVFSNERASFDESISTRPSTPIQHSLCRSQTSYRAPLEERFMDYISRYCHQHIIACKNDNGLLTEPLLRLLSPGQEHAASFIFPGCPSLFIAIMLGKAEVARGLLKTTKYALLLNRNQDHANFLLGCAVSYNNISTIIQLLLENGIDTSASDIWGDAVPHITASNRSMEIAQFLLDNWADIPASGKAGDTAPLHNTASKESVEIVQLLLDNGADVSVNSKWGNIALSLAISSRSVEIAQLLLDNGATISASNIWRNTALRIAASQGSVEIVQLLLDNGVLASASDE
ncbi:hypothetical protein DFP73DRAFT_515030, partial [Morchella snyderi]